MTFGFDFHEPASAGGHHFAANCAPLRLPPLTILLAFAILTALLPGCTVTPQVAERQGIISTAPLAFWSSAPPEAAFKGLTDTFVVFASEDMQEDLEVVDLFDYYSDEDVMTGKTATSAKFYLFFAAEYADALDDVFMTVAEEEVSAPYRPVSFVRIDRTMSLGQIHTVILPLEEYAFVVRLWPYDRIRFFNLAKEKLGEVEMIRDDFDYIDLRINPATIAKTTTYPVSDAADTEATKATADDAAPSP